MKPATLPIPEKPVTPQNFPQSTDNHTMPISPEVSKIIPRVQPDHNSLCVESAQGLTPTPPFPCCPPIPAKVRKVQTKLQEWIQVGN